MTSKSRGTICGLAAAMSYGCNPFALFLYAMGISVNSVLSYRYGIATLVLGLLMLLRRRPLRITRRQTALTAALGILFAGSSLTLFLSFRLIDAGLASTMLFIYPVLVAVIMALFFGERLRPAVAAAIILAITGVAFLCDNTVIGTGDIRGVLLVMLSSLLYAVYMVIVKVSRIALPADTLTYHVLAWGTVAIVAFSLIAPSEPLQLLHGAAQWGWAIFLALVPTVISIILTNAALRDIGPTPTAILGALEPMTAVLIGTLVFGEAFTPRLATGIAVILTAVILVVAPRPKIHLNRNTHSKP